MLISFEQVVTEIDVGGAELTAWIERSWVLPVDQDGTYFFDDADLARARLIAELHRDLGVNEEAMPVVLRLLDQVYGLRRTLDGLQQAITALPDEARELLHAELNKVRSKPGAPEDS